MVVKLRFIGDPRVKRKGPRKPGELYREVEPEDFIILHGSGGRREIIKVDSLAGQDQGRGVF